MVNAWMILDSWLIVSALIRSRLMAARCDLRQIITTFIEHKCFTAAAAPLQIRVINEIRTNFISTSHPNTAALRFKSDGF